MSTFTRMFKQKATYWAPLGIDIFGDLSFNTPITLTVKWEDKNELFLGADGRESVSASIVYLPSDVIRGGYLFLGTSIATDPLTLIGANIIKIFNKIPNYNGTDFERKAIL